MTPTFRKLLFSSPTFTCMYNIVLLSLSLCDFTVEEEKMDDVVRVKSPEMEAEKATKEAEKTGKHGHIYAPSYSYH